MHHQRQTITWRNKRTNTCHLTFQRRIVLKFKEKSLHSKTTWRISLICKWFLEQPSQSIRSIKCPMINLMPRTNSEITLTRRTIDHLSITCINSRGQGISHKTIRVCSNNTMTWWIDQLWAKGSHSTNSKAETHLALLRKTTRKVKLIWTSRTMKGDLPLPSSMTSDKTQN